MLYVFAYYAVEYVTIDLSTAISTIFLKNKNIQILHVIIIK